MPAKPLKPDIKPEQPMEDLSHSLAGLGESTTAAELVRTKGQSKKLKVITEKQLMDWVNTVITRHMAGKVDSISDKEKEEMLKKVQEELAKRIKREQDAQSERDRMKSDLDKAMAKVAEAQSSAASAEQTAEAIDSLKKALAEREQMIEELQQDKYELEDQLAENRALASTTLAEKDEMGEKHKQGMKNYMLRANTLVEGVLGLDNQLYGGRHIDENPVSDDAPDEEQFYHDYDVGAKVIETLSNDLQRLRGIAQSAQKQTERLANDPRMNLLEGDLQLLEQLKGGSLTAVDVAEPVEGLVEAMNGARTEAQQLEHTGKQALGMAAGREDAIAAVPATDSGSPAEVLAGTTGVVREFAAILARGRQRMVALKEMADQADEARNSAEEELGEMRAAYQQVLGTVAERAKADKQRVPTALVDEDAPLAESSAKAAEIIKNIKGGGDVKPIISEQLILMDRLLGDEAGVRMVPPAKDASDEDFIARLREDSAALARLMREKSQALTAAQAREKSVAEEIRALAKTRADITPEHQGDEKLDASVVQLARALDDAEEPAQVANAAQQVIHQLREQLAKAPSQSDIKRLDEERGRLASQIGQAQQKIRSLEEEVAKAKGDVAAVQARGEAQRRAERDMANEVVRAAKGDDQLADAVTDLALAADADDEDNLVPALREAVTGLSRRKQDLDEENKRLRAELDALRSKAQEAESRGAALHSDQQKLHKNLSEAQQHVQEMERDLSRARTDLDLMRNQAQEANSRRATLEAERGKAFSQLTSMEQRLRDAEAELAKARGELAAISSSSKAQSEAGRAVATELVSAAKGDPELADTIADLALALEDTPSSEQPMDTATVSRQVAAGVAHLAQRKQALAQQAERLQQDANALRWQLKEAHENAVALEGERDEMAASGKEVINLLTHQKERTVQELEALKRSSAENEALLTRFQGRTLSAETANRQLAEALSTLASLEKDQHAGEVEDKRVDLELALSQLPDEGEDAVSIPENLSLQLAESGRKLAEALLSRRAQMTTSFKRAQEDQESLKAQLDKLRAEVTVAQNKLDEQQSSLRSSQAEVKAVRHELTMQGKDLAAKVQELTGTRGEVASIKAELDVAAQRVEEQDLRLQQTTAKLVEAQREQERLLRELGQHQQRGDAAEHTQAQLVQALRSLTNRQDASPTVARALTDADQADPLSKAAQKLDLARAAGPEQLASAGQAYIHALKDRVQTLAERMEGARGELAATKRSEDSLNNELAALRASVIDREHQVQNLADELAKANAQQSDLLNQMMEQRRHRDEAQAELKQLNEQLRLAQAEVADYQARDGASSGHLSSDLDRLRQEANKERANRAEIEDLLAQAQERADAAEARIKSQREELTKRLAERDHEIDKKDRQLKELAEQRADIKGLEARVETLTSELAKAHEDLKQFETQFGAHAGNAAKSTDLAREMKNLSHERDALREKLRTLEADLAEANSTIASKDSLLSDKRKTGSSDKEKKEKELLDMRDTVTAVRDEVRKLKEENAGLKARIRRLTDNNAGSGPSGGFKTV
jgi:chromosome segregation ATPase